MSTGIKKKQSIVYSTKVINACIVHHFDTDTKVQTATKDSSKTPQFEVASQGKC